MSDTTAAVPVELTCKLDLFAKLTAAFAGDADQGVEVFLGNPAGDAAVANIWVGPVTTDKEPRGLRGDQGPSYRGRPVVSVHVDVEDTVATEVELTTEVWTLAGRVEALVRDASKLRDWGDGIYTAAVARTSSSGVLPLDGGGFVEQVVVDVAFTVNT